MAKASITELKDTSDVKQFTTFKVGENLFGLDVISTQEVTKFLPMTNIPLAPFYVHGLINLRGQIATALSLRDLFDIDKKNSPVEPMNVICQGDGVLFSLLVDQIGDVLSVSEDLFEPIIESSNNTASKYMTGVYKIPGALLSILNVNKIIDVLQK
jgi:purine-binding chemotaxis protein CheW